MTRIRNQFYIVVFVYFAENAKRVCGCFVGRILSSHGRCQCKTIRKCVHTLLRSGYAYEREVSICIGVFRCLPLIMSQRWHAARWKLYHLLYYYKTYPTNRHLAVLTGARDIRHYRATMVRRTHFLAGRMRTLMETAWNERWSCPNPVADIFPGAMGAVDTFPTRSP